MKTKSSFFSTVFFYTLIAFFVSFGASRTFGYEWDKTFGVGGYDGRNSVQQTIDVGDGSEVLSWEPSIDIDSSRFYMAVSDATDAEEAVDARLFANSVTELESVPKWVRWDQSFISTVGYSNPYNDLTLSVTYNGPSGQNIQTYGFWDGGDTFRIRFMFPEVGRWTWETSCSDVTNIGLHGQTGAVDVVDYVGGNPLYTKGYPAVSDDNRYLVYGDGSPFFWFADTAWSAPMNATQAEWESYVDNRRDKRFNVIQLLIGIDVSDARATVDIYGNGPFFGWRKTDLSSWNPAFWQEYERKVQYANDQGIIIVIQGVADPRSEREPREYELPELLRFAQNLVARFLGNFVVFTGTWDFFYGEEGNAVGLAMRQTSALHLISQHPPWFDYDPGDDENHSIETAEMYYDQPYLDFSGLQSSAGWTKVKNLLVNDLAAKNAIEWTPLLYNRKPHKPVITLEAIYDSSVRHDPDDPYHTTVSDLYLPRMARSSGYWGVLSGSAGHTFGCGLIFSWGPRTVSPQGGNWPWYVAMNQPSSLEMQYLYEFFTTYEWWRLVPRHDLILSQQPEQWINHMVLSKTDNGDLAIAYLPDNPEIEIDMSAFDTIMAVTWFDPSNNVYQAGGGSVAPIGTYTFQKPAGWQDAVLLLETTTPPVMATSPNDGLSSSGMQGGPFTPSSKEYTVQNTSAAPINYSVTKTASWLSLSNANGILQSGANATVTMTINYVADTLTPNTYSDTLTFTDITNSGSTTRPVYLTIYSGDPKNVFGYTPVTPCRIVDTRNTSAGKINASTQRPWGGQRRFRVFGSGGTISAQGGSPAGCPSPDGVPYAAHINMVAVNPTGKGNLQAFPMFAGTGAGLSVNYNTIDTNLANAGTVKTVTSTEPDIAVASNFSSAHTVIDVLGYYYPDGDLTYTPVTPCRIVDTRKAGGIIGASTQRDFHVYGSGGAIGAQGGDPDGCFSPLGESLAAHINMVAVNPTGKGNLQAFPVGARAGAGLSVNYNTIDTNLANAGTVKTITSSGPDITVASNFSSAHTAIDVLGYYYPDGDLTYTPVTPCRIVDTRKTSAGIIDANTQRNFRAFGSVGSQGGNAGGCSSPLGQPLAAHINIVAVDPSGKGNLQAFPVGAVTGAGLSVNYNTIDTNLANAGTIKTVTGSGADFTVASNFSSAHTVIDVLGYYYPAP